jgi:CheY-specific phosphatase CheX
MQPSERRDFREIVIGACRHVLPQCGLPVGADPTNLEVSVDPAEQLAAFIGFSAGALRGAITMLLPVSLARRSYPLQLKSGIEADLELFDWSGEIVNRLLGRVKSGLAARGVDVEPSTPKTMLGEQIQFVVSEQTNVCALRFGCGTDALAVLVDAISAEDKVLFRSSPANTVSQPEGELLLF